MKRRISAILAADIAGYSGLVAQDEGETLRRLATSRAALDDLVSQWGGRRLRSAGDAALAEFPSAVDAVRCALDIHEGMGARNLAFPQGRRMLYRIGVTVAEVVEQDGDLVGDGVNNAASLSGLAVPGGICVSHEVHEQVANKLSVGFEDLGAQQAKNVPNAIRAYRIVPHRVAVDDSASRGAVPANGARRRSRRLAGLAIAAAVGAVVIALALRGLPQGSSVAGSAPVPQPPAGRSANLSFDDAKVRALAASQSIPLPPTLKIMTPAATVPARLAGYLGAWGGDQGWNGVGRRVILVVESIDETGTAVGILGQGPPPDNVPDQRPARYRSVAGTITEAGLIFVLGGATFTFKDTADGLMWGHAQMPGERKTEMSITLERLE